MPSHVVARTSTGVQGSEQLHRPEEKSHKHSIWSGNEEQEFFSMGNTTSKRCGLWMYGRRLLLSQKGPLLQQAKCTIGPAQQGCPIIWQVSILNSLNMPYLITLQWCHQEPSSTVSHRLPIRIPANHNSYQPKVSWHLRWHGKCYFSLPSASALPGLEKSERDRGIPPVTFFNPGKEWKEEWRWVDSPPPNLLDQLCHSPICGVVWHPPTDASEPLDSSHLQSRPSEWNQYSQSLTTTDSSSWILVFQQITPVAFIAEPVLTIDCHPLAIMPSPTKKTSHRNIPQRLALTSF